MKHTTIAVDIAKSVFEIAVSTRPGQVEKCQRLSRARFLHFFAQREPATVVVEACGSAHHWGRKLRELGHTVVLLPPQYVRPYVRRNKTDRTDAKALLEAYRNEQIEPVPLKSVEQHQLGALHRLRSGWLATRTARLNCLPGLLRELGWFIPVGAQNVVPHVLSLAEDAESGLPEAIRPALFEGGSEIRDLESRIEAVELQLQALSQQLPAVERLRSVPGIGLLTATALLAFVGDVVRFRSARRFASFIGLTPRERSTGNVRRLGGISKRGDVYLRMLLIHGARSVLWHAKRQESPDRLRAWALKLERLRGHNKAAVALANKLARISWAVLRHDRNFESKAA
jgi:transposase